MPPVTMTRSPGFVMTRMPLVWVVSAPVVRVWPAMVSTAPEPMMSTLDAVDAAVRDGSFAAGPMVTASTAPGTPGGLQLDGFAQSVDTAPVHVFPVAFPVAVNVTGLPLRLGSATVADIVLVPGVVPSVHPPTWATPEAFVVAVVGSVRLPPPDVTAKVTEAPMIGFPAASSTRTAGATGTDVPAGADWPSP